VYQIHHLKYPLLYPAWDSLAHNPDHDKADGLHIALEEVKGEALRPGKSEEETADTVDRKSGMVHRQGLGHRKKLDCASHRRTPWGN